MKTLCDFPENQREIREFDRWHVMLTAEGIETLPEGLARDYFCENPLCRGLGNDLVDLFSQCSHAAPGKLG